VRDKAGKHEDEQGQRLEERREERRPA
jgi:hypothetical protein